MTVACPNLKFVVLDVIHPCFTVEQAHRGKRKSSSILQTIQNKFNKWSPEIKTSLGKPFVEGQQIIFSTEERRLRQQILQCSMQLATANRRLSKLDGDVPYLNHKDWIADLAALCAVYKDEVSVSTTQKNTKICKMIWNMTSANKIGFYFNSLRRLDLAPPQQRPQLSSGTSAVETMNFQTNKRFKNIVELYQSSLELKCCAFQFLKLFSHNCAEYCPTEYQVSQQTILDHNLSVWQFTEAEWATIQQTSTTLLEEKRTSRKNFKTSSSEGAWSQKGTSGE